MRGICSESVEWRRCNPPSGFFMCHPKAQYDLRVYGYQEREIFMVKIIVFILASIGISLFSLKSFRARYSHGFFRFFAFEGILVLILLNIDVWFSDHGSLHQIISWFLLTGGLYFVIAGTLLLRRIGKPSADVNQPGNVGFENTTTLVTEGIYRYIRHPMYASLLWLCWGVYFKDPTLTCLAIAAAVTVFLYTTARVEERENIKRFGGGYEMYMTRSKMFIPFVF
jgi:protein-S-isoprenylcysteine O-methyltransferase Ste14